MSLYRGKLADPQFRKTRGELGAAGRHSTDTLISSLVRREPELTDDHRAQLVPVALPTDDDLIAVVAQRAPELSSEQVDRLRAVLPDGGH